MTNVEIDPEFDPIFASTTTPIKPRFIYDSEGLYMYAIEFLGLTHGVSIEKVLTLSIHLHSCVNPSITITWSMPGNSIADINDDLPPFIVNPLNPKSLICEFGNLLESGKNTFTPIAVNDPDEFEQTNNDEE